jgi:hypothetical protein
MSLPLIQQDVMDYLTKKEFKPILQKETGQVYITFNINKMDIHIFFVIISEGNLLQTIAYIPFTYMDKVQGDLARLLHLLNKEIDMPGFGMDEQEKLIFYRCVIPSIDKKIDPEFIDLYLEATKVACETFISAIGVVATGSAKFDQLLEESRQEAKRKMDATHIKPNTKIS